MKPRRRFSTALFGLVALTALSRGLAPSQAQAPAPSAADPTPSQAAANSPVPTHADHVRPQAAQRQSRRSIVHHYAYPYPGYYHGDDTAGFRNPGGVGRYSEYYPAGPAQSQLEREHVPAAPPVAQFDTNPATNRQEQIQATQVGIQRYNSIQNHIDRYSQPYMGYGFGVGGYGGFW